MDVWFLLTPGYLALDLAGPAEALRIAAEEGVPFRLHMAGPEAACPNSLGLVLQLDPLPLALPSDAWVVLCGNRDEVTDYATPAADALVAWLRTHAQPPRRVATICSGALLAARAGLLDGRQCTTHHALTGMLTRLAPRARVVENRTYVRDGPLWTSAGITAGIDLALALIEEVAGPAVVARVARRMVVYLRRSGDDPQLSPWLAYRNHLHPAVHRAQDLIARDPAAAWSVEALAESVHVSARHLTRLFRQEAGLGIVEYQQRLRVARARQLIGQGASVERAAEGAGFGSARALRRVWQKFEPGTPGQLRI